MRRIAAKSSSDTRLDPDCNALTISTYNRHKPPAPINISGLRPNLSTRAIAKIVNEKQVYCASNENSLQKRLIIFLKTPML